MTKDNKNKISTIVLCAGGSGGHIFPAESLGTELQKKGFNIILLTDKRGQAFKGKDFSVHRVSGEAVTGRGFIRKIIALAKLGLGTLQAYIFFKKVKPVIVIGFGGFASIPGAAAAVLSRIPLVIHEQNAVLGRANRLMAKKASLIITSFAETSMLPQGVRVKHGGMPIRPEVAAQAGAPYPKLDAASPINILVIGGSQGASILSRVLPDAFKLLPDSLKKRIKLAQQCRPEDIDDVRAAFIGSGIDHELATFFNDIPERMAKAHLILSRSGSSSMAELFTIGRPAILIPFARAADNHQTANAMALTECGGGFLIPEAGFTVENVNERLQTIFKNPEILQKAAACALVPDMPEVPQKLCRMIEDEIKAKENKK